MFTRSAQGLSNEHIFRKVDFIVYVEVGNPSQMNDEQIVNYETNDEVFWSGIFSILRPDLKFFIKVYGSKTDLRPIARGVVESNIGNTVVCFDSDYSEFVNSKFSHQRILYTYGYSWENDVINWSEIENIAYLINPVPAGRIDFEAHKNKLFNRIERTGRRTLVIDIAYARVGQVIKRKSNPSDLVKFDDEKIPYLCLTTIMERIRKARKIVSPLPFRKMQLNFWRWFHGHTIEYIICEWLNLSVTQTRRPNRWKKPLVMLTLIRRFHKEMMTSESEVSTYYRNELAKIA